MNKEQQKIIKQTEEIIAKLKTMSYEELNELYAQYKELLKSLQEETKEAKVDIAISKDKMKDRPEMDEDTMYKTIFASCFASMVGGATLGGLLGGGAKEFFGGALLGTAFGTIFVSLITAYIYETKPVAKVVHAIKKYALERKVDKLEKQQSKINKVTSAIEEEVLEKA